MRKCRMEQEKSSSSLMGNKFQERTGFFDRFHWVIGWRHRPLFNGRGGRIEKGFFPGTGEGKRKKERGGNANTMME